MSYFSLHIGEFAALATAIFWVFTALAFEVASKQLGSLPLNLLRLVVAIFFLGILSVIRGYSFFPSGASEHQWVWLSLSGIVGFVLGDLFLFKALAMVGARISLLLMALAPPLAALVGWLLMNETLSLLQLLAMFVTIGGIVMAITTRAPATEGKKRKMTLAHSGRGIFYAFLGAAGQAIGLVLSKYGMQDYDPFRATQIRIFAGTLGFVFVIAAFRRWRHVGAALKNRIGMKYLIVGAFFGPFLGVSFSLLSVKYTTTGVAATIMSLEPVLLIPASIFFFKEKVKTSEILGAVIAVVGVMLFFYE